MEVSSTQNSLNEENDSNSHKPSEHSAVSENTNENCCSSEAQQNDLILPKSKEVSLKNFNFNGREEGNSSNSATESPTNSWLKKKNSKKPITLAFAARQRPRQPFFGTDNQRQFPNQRIPAPPSYYPTRRQNEPITQQPERSARPQEHLFRPQQAFDIGPFTTFPHLLMNSVYWAPYPSKIPADAPVCLAHLLDAEVLFIIQKIDLIELITSAEEPNIYLIQNEDGECIYLAYETSDICGRGCCPHSRGFQIHILDMYQNEVMYLNRPCGCTYLFCCYPVLEIYAPPTVPVGAVTKVFHPFREEFIIIDPHEQLMFKIHGDSTLKLCSSCFDYNFSIEALDAEKTIVGYIRRKFAGYTRSFYTDADFYGISFPKNMDVRIKASFLGALFLIDIMYFE